jgi:hypothetical protein
MGTGTIKKDCKSAPHHRFLISRASGAMHAAAEISIGGVGPWTIRLDDSAGRFLPEAYHPRPPHQAGPLIELYVESYQSTYNRDGD